MGAVRGKVLDEPGLAYISNPEKVARRRQSHSPIALRDSLAEIV
jgi:hypothetical protein